MSREKFEDDGRTVADMSGIERQPLVMPRRNRRDEAAGRAPETADERSRPWESTFTPEERRITVFAALKAALLIGLCYIVGLGAAILLMIRLWT